MAHQIYQDRAMMWVGQKPWHGLGTEFPANATYEQVAAAVGFYHVEERELYASGVGLVPDRKALVRGDTGQYLVTVGIDYGVIQIEESARAVLDAAREIEGAVFHTAGLLGDNGARFWLLGELGSAFKVPGYESEVKKYILATGAHDGLTAWVLKNTGVNVVCANTLAMSLNERGQSYRVRHTSNATSRVQEAVKGMQSLIDRYTDFEALAATMAETRFSPEMFVETIDRILPLPEDGKPHPKLQNQRAAIAGLCNSSVGGEGVSNTAWSAYQSWTEFADHYLAPADKAGRLESTWFGRGQAITQDALAAIVDVASIDMPSKLAA